MKPSSSFWRPVDWFVPPALRGEESDQLRRTRLLVVCILLLVPLMLFGAFELYVVGTLVAAQAQALAWSTLVLVGCLALLKATRSLVLTGTLFCLHLTWTSFFLATTDLGLQDPILAWTILVPMIAAFVVGPRLAVGLAVGLIALYMGLHELEVRGAYVPPALSAPDELRWFSLIILATATGFSALLAWLYEGYTVRRLRQMNASLRLLRTELEASEERYRSLFDHIPVGVYRSLPNGRITMANEALLTMLGAPTVDALATVDAASLYADPAERARLTERLDTEGEVYGAEFTLIALGGRRLRVRESARAARSADGRVLYYEGAIEDVTAQRRAEQAARRTEERYRTLVQHSSDVITILDESGLIRYQSPSVTQNLGYDPEATLGAHMLDLVHPEDRRRVEVLFERGLRAEAEFGSVQFRARHAEGHYVYVEAVGANMLSNPYIRGVVLNSRDVTERKRAEVALVRAKEQAEEVARLKSTFLANMSHEIRTPLTGIIGFAGVLAEEVDEEHREFVELIERSGRRLLQTLNSVLDLARLEADQMEVRLEPLDVGAQVADAVAVLTVLAEEKGLRLETEGADAGAEAHLDAACLHRIVTNLVGNAVKFTDEGGVRVAVRAENGAVVLSVEDTGVGIDPTFFPHLFEEFKQESTGVQRSHEGSGLGLSITQKLVELMGGTIAVESAKGRGTTFTVSFPQAAPSEAPAAPAAPAAPLGRPRLLVLDDNESTLILMDRMLRDVADADLAASAEEALRHAAQAEQPHDVVFLDIHLAGGTSGADVLRQLRALPAYARTPVVAFTAFALPGDRERFINTGFDGYLGKPFTRDQLVALLTELLPGGAPPLAPPPGREGRTGAADADAEAEALFGSGVFLGE